MSSTCVIKAAPLSNNQQPRVICSGLTYSMIMTSLFLFKLSWPTSHTDSFCSQGIHRHLPPPPFPPQKPSCKSEKYQSEKDKKPLSSSAKWNKITNKCQYLGSNFCLSKQHCLLHVLKIFTPSSSFTQGIFLSIKRQQIRAKKRL